MTLTSIVIISLVSISTIRDALNSKAMQQLVSIRNTKIGIAEPVYDLSKTASFDGTVQFCHRSDEDFRESFKTYPEEVSILEGAKDLRQKSRELRSYYDGPLVKNS